MNPTEIEKGKVETVGFVGAIGDEDFGGGPVKGDGTLRSDEQALHATGRISQISIEVIRLVGQLLQKKHGRQ